MFPLGFIHTKSATSLALSVCLLTSSLLSETASSASVVEGLRTGIFAVKIADGEDADLVASEMGAENLGRIGPLEGYYRFKMPRVSLRAPLPGEEVMAPLEEHASIEWAEEQIAKQLYHQAAPDSPQIEDPLFEDQWHWRNAGQTGGVSGEDSNITPVWNSGLDGSGVVVAVVDDGTEYTHPDLAPNFRLDLSWDYNGEDSDPAPEDAEEDHGTAVSGIVAAASNDLGGVGTAFGVDFSSIRLIAGPVTDATQAEALTHRFQEIDIYNNSWGPTDGERVEFGGFGFLSEAAVKRGVDEGRGGLGNIYVWSAGNGRDVSDNSNYDSYGNSPYTIAVGAVGQKGEIAFFSEPGASVLLVAPSRGGGGGILTTDRVGTIGFDVGDYTPDFGGTSASAPIVSGVVALMLEANPDLTWRDVQHILVRSSVRVDSQSEGWSRNGADMWVHHDYGFGRVDAYGATRLAQEWPGTPEQSVIESAEFTSVVGGIGSIPDGSAQGRSLEVAITEEITIEHVELDIAINHSHWGDLTLVLESPDGTESILMEPHNNARGNQVRWTFMSVRHWGESTVGTWRVRVVDEVLGDSGSIETWQLRFYGTQGAPISNRAPIVENESYQSLSFPLTMEVLGNDSDPDGDSLQIISIYQPANGSAALDAEGRLIYEADSDFRGIDRVGYTVGDGRGEARQAFVEIVVPLPIATRDSAVAIAGESVKIDVLLNDSDPDGDDLVVSLEAGPNSGTVEYLGDGVFSYTPASDFLGSDTFTYRLTDNDDGFDLGEVVLTVAQTNDFALNYVGFDDRIDAGSDSALNLTGAITIEAWINPTGWGEDQTNGYGRIVDKEKFILFLSNDAPAFYNDFSLVFLVEKEDGSTTAANTGASTVLLNEWQHVAVTYDGVGEVRFFRNGALIETFAASGIDFPSGAIGGNAVDPLIIGDSNGRDRGFEGAFSEIRLWNRVRSASEIADDFESRLNGSESGLVLYFPMDEGVGRLLRDRSGTGANGTIIGATWISGPSLVAQHPARLHFPDAMDAGSDWWLSPWFGWVNVGAYPWVFHREHGWIYLADPVSQGFWLLHPVTELSWVFSSPTLYPWVFSSVQQDWLFYDEGSSSPLWFFRSQDAIWIPFDP